MMSVRKDGSGTIEVVYALPDNTAAQMKALHELQKEMIRAAGEKYVPRPVDMHFRLLMDPSDTAARELMKNYDQYGIELESYKIDVLEGRRQVRLRLRFADLAKAAGSDLFRIHWPTTLEKTDDGNYRLSVTNGRPAEEPNLNFSDPATIKAITPILKGFKASIRINVPGEIVTAGASHGKNSAVWTFSFSKDPRAFSAYKAARMSILFKGEGLALPEVTQTAPSP